MSPIYQGVWETGFHYVLVVLGKSSIFLLGLALHHKRIVFFMKTPAPSVTGVSRATDFVQPVRP